MVASMSSATYEQLKLAVELGKWPDGAVLSDAQLAHSLQLVMAYDSYHQVNPTEPFRINVEGLINQPSKKSPQSSQIIELQDRRPE